jgi:hypothetical protein
VDIIIIIIIIVYLFLTAVGLTPGASYTQTVHITENGTYIIKIKNLEIAGRDHISPNSS